MTTAPAQTLAPLAPFAHKSFALLWSATLVSYVGTWMHDVSAAWLMTSLSASPLVVALVQGATTAAMALFALPAGALADLLDRKRLLIVLAAFKASLAALLGLLTALGIVETWSLLAITFLLGVGAALMAPAWQSTIPTLVPRPVLKPAIALNSLGINIARAIGPSIAGVLIVSASVASVFFLNAASELVILAALLLWKPAVVATRRRPESFVPAMAAGLRFAAHAPSFKVVLIRSAAFFLFVSAFWALIPLVVRTLLAGEAALYGLLVGAVGAGAVAGALALPWLDRKLGADRLVQLGTLGAALVLVVLGFVPVRSIAVAASLLAGVSWIWVLSSLNVAAQNALPEWVRGRGMSIYGLVFFGSMTIGAVLWGALASWAGISVALSAAAAGLLLGLIAVRGWRLQAGEHDLTPAGHWPQPAVTLPVEGDKGPVMVMIDYRIEPSRAAEFVRAAHRLAEERRRDGAYQWGLMQDVADPVRYIEYFFVESWAEHERQHGRVTKADADLQAAIRRLHTGPGEPIVRHLLMTNPEG